MYEIPFILNKIENIRKHKINLDGDIINAFSPRLLCFKYNGVDCIKCGRRGGYFKKDKRPTDIVYHLNLYSVDDVLMTVPGNKHNIIENLNTVCKECLEKKNGI
jgi:hypothetical protein